MRIGRFAPWLFVASALFVAIATVVSVVEYRRSADQSSDELETLLRASSQVNALSAMEWQAIAEGEVTPELRENIEAVGNAAEADLASVARGDAPDGEEATLLATYRSYSDAIDQEVTLVDDGRLEAAHRLDEGTVDPLYVELDAAIDKEVATHETEAAAGSMKADIGTGIIVVLGVIVAGTLLWSQEAMRRRAQLAVARLEQAEAVKASEQKFQAMVENLSEIVYIQDREGVVTYVSPAVRLVAGYEPEDIVGTRFSEFIYPEDQPMVAQSFLSALHGQSKPLEYRALTADGRVRWVRSASRPIVENGEIVGLRGVLMDITDLKTAQEDLVGSNATLQAIVEASPLAIIAIKPDKTVALWNPAAEQLFGWSVEEALGMPYSLASAGSEAEFAVLLEKVLAGDEVAGFETRRRKKDGELIDVSISAAPLRGRDNEITGALGLISDITARKRAEEMIRHLAYHDPLTGLPNRALFTDRLEVALAQARRSQQPLAVLYLDIDNLKSINDSVGHSAGDVLLRVVADRLRGLIRDSDTVARVGGDEFTILLGAATGDTEASEIASRIVGQLRGPWQYENIEFNISGSVGVAVYPADGLDAETLLKHADQAMYTAKSESRDTFRAYRPSMSDVSESKLAMDRDLRKALKENQFVVHYQPQIDIRTGKMAGVEALVRWNHPERGLLLPGDFLPLAEATGVIVAIDDWVLETAARQLVDWHAAGYTDMTVAVNLSAVHFAMRGFLRTLRGVLDRTGVNPTHLQIEITETVAMHQTRRTLRTLTTVKRMGIGVVIDDFGTGHASLTYLRHFPVDAIKIDRSFVNGICRNSADETLVIAIVALAHSLDMDVIAEGVETQEQLEFLKNLRAGNSPERTRGCDYFQGFLSSRAVSAEEVGALLDTQDVAVAIG